MENSRKDWCRLPYSVIMDENLNNWAAKVLYSVLLDVSNDWVVTKTMDRIAELAGMKLRYVRKLLEQLQEAGYIISRKTDGRRLILELRQIELAGNENGQEPKPKKKRKSKSEPPPENSEHVEEALMNILAKKMQGKSQKRISAVYDELKVKAAVNVKDPKKILSYLSTIISNYQDKPDSSDGFDPDEYEEFLNCFD